MLRESLRPGIEPATYKSQVQYPTAEPPLVRATKLPHQLHLTDKSQTTD